MKIRNIVFVVLLLPSMSCFSMSQKLIDGAENYKTALWNLQKIEKDLDIANKDYRYWVQKLPEVNVYQYGTDTLKEVRQNEVDKVSKHINELNAKYTAAQSILKQYEPLKIEYDKQVAWEHKMDDIKDAVLSGVMLGLIISAFALFFWYAYRRNKKYEHLFKEGRITQEEYTSSTSSAASNSTTINPTTGLPIIGIGSIDVGGTAFGASPTQSCSARHRWD